MTNSKDDPTKKLDDVLSRFLSEPPEEKDLDTENKTDASDDKDAEKPDQKH